MSTRRPSFQFYPDDWLTDLALRQCSASSRGIWMDVICLMHQGEPYGFLAGKNGPLAMKVVASVCGVSVKTLTTALRELEANSVFSRTADGTIYSRRMVKDEQVRQARAAGGIKSLGNPSVPRPKDTNKDILTCKNLSASHAEDEEVGVSSSFSVDGDDSDLVEMTVECAEAFREFIELFPHKIQVPEAKQYWAQNVTLEATWRWMKAALKHELSGDQKILAGPETWLRNHIEMFRIKARPNGAPSVYERNVFDPKTITG